MAGENAELDRGRDEGLLPPRLAPYQQLAMKAPPSFSALFSIGPAQEALFGELTRVELLKRRPPS